MGDDVTMSLPDNLEVEPVDRRWLPRSELDKKHSSVDSDNDRICIRARLERYRHRLSFISGNMCRENIENERYLVYRLDAI